MRWSAGGEDCPPPLHRGPEAEKAAGGEAEDVGGALLRSHA